MSMRDYVDIHGQHLQKCQCKKWNCIATYGSCGWTGGWPSRVSPTLKYRWSVVVQNVNSSSTLGGPVQWMLLLLLLLPLRLVNEWSESGGGNAKSIRLDTRGSRWLPSAISNLLPISAGNNFGWSSWLLSKANQSLLMITWPMATYLMVVLARRLPNCSILIVKDLEDLRRNVVFSYLSAFLAIIIVFFFSHLNK